MLFSIITFLLLLAYAVLMLAYSYGWQKARNFVWPKADVLEYCNIFISVIVPARNEAFKIRDCLNSLLNQNFPAHLFEVIVVNDASTDETAEIARSFTEGKPLVKVIDLKPREGIAYKKYAIELGISQASGNIIVSTDADCTHHENWLKSIAKGFAYENVHFIAAPVVYHTKPGLLSVFQTLDFMTLQGITAASVAMHWHSMCNGANLAYTRTAFEEVNGFQGIDNLPTGDDMLLMHKISREFSGSVLYLCQQEAMVYTESVDTWKGFFQQRIRWASKAAYFDDKRIFAVLILVFLLNLWILLLAMAAPLKKELLTLFLGAVFIKTIAELIFLIPVARFFGKERWLWWFPFFQPLHIVYTVLSASLGRFSSYQWKGRQVNKPSSII